jgi:ArsR family transcriptional regulator
MESLKHKAGKVPPGADAWHMLAVVMKALASPVRLQILEAWAAAEQTVGGLAEAIEIERSLVWQHLNVLRHAGFVETERMHQNVVARPTRSARNLSRCCGSLVDCICGKTRAS